MSDVVLFTDRRTKKNLGKLVRLVELVRLVSQLVSESASKLVIHLVSYSFS